MTLMRDTLLVGGATFLVGSVLMEVSVEQEGKEVGWWPYVGTFISGALGFYLLTATDIVKVKNAEDCADCAPGHQCDACIIREVNAAEGPTDDELESWSERQDDGSMLVTIDEGGDSHTELTYQDGDLTDLKRFMAEIFEADRKARRRTTLTWTRGIEPGFKDTNPASTSRGSFGLPDGTQPYSPSGYWNNTQLTDEKAYHITGLPTGYHIHLWKPRRRGNYWNTYMKSPHNDDWKHRSNSKKRQAMSEVLDWYNDQIAIPEKEKLTPIQAMLQQQGLVTGDIQIKRIEPTPQKVQYFYEGGPKGYQPTLFASLKLGREVWLQSNLPEEVKDFCRGLIYLSNRAHTGNLRSVNRYNADRTQWVKSKPAWFQNMCAEDVTSLYVQIDYDKIWEIHTYASAIEFLRFYGEGELKHNRKTIRISDDNSQPAFQVGVSHLDEDGDEIIEWTDPRPSTQRKMYDSFYERLSADLGNSPKPHIFKECVKKYQPQNYEELRTSMTTATLSNDTEGFQRHNTRFSDVTEACHIMLRRFKKKLKIPELSQDEDFFNQKGIDFDAEDWDFMVERFPDWVRHVGKIAYPRLAEIREKIEKKYKILYNVRTPPSHMEMPQMRQRMNKEIKREQDRYLQWLKERFEGIEDWEFDAEDWEDVAEWNTHEPSIDPSPFETVEWETLPVPPPEITHLMNILSKNKKECLVVGGAVRDLLLGLEPKDWDLATNRTPKQIDDVIGFGHKFHSGYPRMVTGKQADKALVTGLTSLILLEEGGEPVEVTTYRSDLGMEEGTRTPIVAPAETFEEDAGRRDFTINAMGMTADGRLIDPMGGQEDLKNGVLRAVGNPNERFIEDPLRMIRAIRFSVRLGLPIEPATYQAILDNVELIPTLSSPRLRQEIGKVLVEPNGYQMLMETGILPILMPEFRNMKDFHHKLDYHPEDTLYNHYIEAFKKYTTIPNRTELGAWALLFHDIAKPQTADWNEEGGYHTFYGHDKQGAKLVLDNYNNTKGPFEFSKKELQAIAWTTDNHLGKFWEMKKPMKVSAMRNDDRFPLLVEVVTGDTMGIRRGGDEELQRRLKEIKEITDKVNEQKAKMGNRPKDFARKVIQELNVQGKEISMALSEIEEMVSTGQVQSYDEALEVLKTKRNA